jgi:hypothetical protein
MIVGRNRWLVPMWALPFQNSNKVYIGGLSTPVEEIKDPSIA